MLIQALKQPSCGISLFLTIGWFLSCPAKFLDVWRVCKCEQPACGVRSYMSTCAIFDIAHVPFLSAQAIPARELFPTLTKSYQHRQPVPQPATMQQGGQAPPLD